MMVRSFKTFALKQMPCLAGSNRYGAIGLRTGPGFSDVKDAQNMMRASSNKCAANWFISKRRGANMQLNMKIYSSFLHPGLYLSFHSNKLIGFHL